MTNYTYLGWGTTDSNGVAKLDHDANDDPISHSYTGSGAGEIDVVASLDKPIAEGSVVSEPTSVIDGKFFDSGIRESKYARWRNNNSSISETFAEDGTLLAQATSGTDGWYLASTGSGDAWNDTQNWTPSFAVEFTIVDMTDGARLRISSEYGSLSYYYSVGDRVKIIYDGSYVDYYKVGSETRLKHSQLTSSAVSIGFSLTNGGTIKFKDFVIYPI